MRWTRSLLLLPALLLVLSGCGKGKEYDGPTVKEFTGSLVQNGKAIQVKTSQEPLLELFLNSQKPESFLIPIQEDGTFKIGWMPIGKYTAALKRKQTNAKSGPSRNDIPGGLTIEDGKTEYVIEVGPGFKP